MGDIVIGKRTVIEAIRSGIPVIKIYVLANMMRKDLFIKDIESAAKYNNVAIREISREKLEQITKTDKHFGVAAEIEEKKFISVERMLANAAKKKEAPFIILLNGIEDPHNFGAILRSAEGAGVHGVIIPKRRAAPVNATTAKTSAGALYHVPIARVANIAQTIMSLKEKGIWIVGTDSSSDKIHYDVDYTTPTAIIIGGEGKGMQDLVKKKCDFIVKIPMTGRIQSLNASVSGGILFYEVVRQRLQGK